MIQRGEEAPQVVVVLNGFDQLRAASAGGLEGALMQNLRKPTAKARDDILAVQLLLRPHDRHGSV